MAERSLRPATEADADLLARLHAPCFEERWDAGAFARLLATPGTGAWVAHDGDGRPVGYAAARLAADQADILSIAVLPDRRSAAHGRRLLQALLAGVTAAGARTVYLEVAEGNTRARAFYIAAGFEEIGRRQGYYRAGPIIEDAIVMRMAIRPAQETEQTSAPS
ncbi:MAG: GNAT family N-acetyltransferase [Azospirillaceae bacterium]